MAKKTVVSAKVPMVHKKLLEAEAAEKESNINKILGGMIRDRLADRYGVKPAR